jgi:hypothetical protein
MSSESIAVPEGVDKSFFLTEEDHKRYLEIKQSGGVNIRYKASKSKQMGCFYYNIPQSWSMQDLSDLSDYTRLFGFRY